MRGRGQILPHSTLPQAKGPLGLRKCLGLWHLCHPWHKSEEIPSCLSPLFTAFSLGDDGGSLANCVILRAEVGSLDNSALYIPQSKSSASLSPREERRQGLVP